MTESKKRSDADAVLSSVRRIVTRQLTAEELGAPPPAMPETRPDPGARRLLLTPALRVGEDPGPARPDPVPQGTSARRRLEERIAELERAVGSVGGEFEPDGSEPQDDEIPREVPKPALRLEPAPAPAPDEAPIMLDATEPEPRPADNAPVPFPGMPEARAEAPRPAAPEPDDRAAEPDPALIEEDVLRQIVAEIVRAELQGELGERITRNVRKLVRREIHRALMTRDYD